MKIPEIPDKDVHSIRKAAGTDFKDDLGHEIEAILSCLDNQKGLPHNKPDMIQLISSIETAKLKCLQGEINSKRFYSGVNYALSLF